MIYALLIVCATAAGLVAAPARARETGAWDRNQDALILRWFQTLTQPDHPNVSCCGEADAYEADTFEVEGDHYVAIITAHRGPTAIPIGTRIPVANHKLKYDQGNPTGHRIIFIGAAGQVFCYVTPGGI